MGTYYVTSLKFQGNSTVCLCSYSVQNDAGCAALAVILQFLHCVVFMWMMMEGVVLYIKLVRVFDDNDKVYFILFTILCYGKKFYVIE